MTQKAVFSKQMIVETAFELTHAEGWQAVTARNIARKLSSSTMPIYSGWKSMVGIEQEVRRRAESLMVEYQRKAYTADQALNAAFGYVTFARDERHLFRFLYVDRPLPAEIRGNNPPVKVTPEGVTSGRAVPGLADQVPLAMQDPRILKSWIFAHGLASLISSGVLELSDERIKSLLLEAGGAIFMYEKMGREKKGT